MGSVPRPRQNPKVRAAILGAALSLVREVGYDKLTIEGIAARAGCGKQTIYRWWASKALVLLEALVENTKWALNFADSGDFRKDMIDQMQRVTTLLTGEDTGRLFIGLLFEAQFVTEVARSMNTLIYEPTYALAKERVASAQRAGQLDPDLDPKLIVQLIYSPIYYRLIVPYWKLAPEDVPELLHRVLVGLEPRRP